MSYLHKNNTLALCIGNYIRRGIKMHEQFACLNSIGFELYDNDRLNSWRLFSFTVHQSFLIIKMPRWNNFVKKKCFPLTGWRYMPPDQ